MTADKFFFLCLRLSFKVQPILRQCLRLSIWIKQHAVWATFWFTRKLWACNEQFWSDHQSSLGEEGGLSGCQSNIFKPCMMRVHVFKVSRSQFVWNGQTEGGIFLLGSDPVEFSYFTIASCMHGWDCAQNVFCENIHAFPVYSQPWQKLEHVRFRRNCQMRSFRV